MGGLVWLMGVEDAARSSLGDVAGYLPGELWLALAIAPNGRVMLLAAATMGVYVVLLMLGGARAMLRDVPG